MLTLLLAGTIAVAEAPDTLLGVVVFYLAYHNLEGAVLQPRIMSAAVSLSGLAIVAALVIGYEIAGVTGMLVAVPSALLVAELAAHSRRAPAPGR